MSPVCSAGERVDSLAGHAILFPADLLAMPGNEETDLARGQSVILHLAVVAQRGDYVRRRAFRISSYVIQYFGFQAHETRQLLTAYSV